MLNDQGQLFSFGKGSNGRLGVGQLEGADDTQSNGSSSSNLPSVSSPTLIATTLSAFKNIVHVDSGCRHAAALTDKGEMFTWGFNYYDQLGTGASEHDEIVPVRCKLPQSIRIAQVSCGYFHSAALADI